MSFLRLLVALLVTLLPSLGGAEVLRAATAEWSPYAMLRDGQPEGIVVDILREIERRTGITFEVSIYPPSRLNMLFERGEIDLNFADSPVWNARLDVPRAVFSETFMEVREYIYFRRGHAREVRTPDDLAGLTVGVTRGYYYPLFEDAFKRRKVKRYDVNTNESLIAMLRAGRVDAAFMDDVLFESLLHQLGLADEFTRGRELSVAPLGFKFRADRASTLPAINNAIRQMKANGEIRRIVSRYTDVDKGVPSEKAKNAGP